MKKFAALITILAILFTHTAFSLAEEAADKIDLPADVASEPEIMQEEEPSEPETYFDEDASAPSEAQEEPAQKKKEPKISQKWINLYVDEKLTATYNRIMYIDDVLYVPAEEMALLLGIEVKHFTFTETAESTSLYLGENFGHFFKNSCYAILNDRSLDLKNKCFDVDGVLYMPLYVLKDLFSLEFEENNDGPDPDIYVKSFISAKAKEYEEKIASLGLTSQTDYLIWVSKANYSVRLFKKSAAGWKFADEYPCAIGAPSSPTCEGVYKFYERVAGWYYSDYYVGPVMRFNGGYALHSTLIYYNGKPKNDSVGVKISHGCVRLHKEDIQYLYDNIPLYTTVYVSAF